MLTELLFAGLSVALAFLVAIFLKLSALPVTLRAQARRERTEGQAEAMEALQEAAAAKVGPITVSLRTHEEQAAARHREEIGAAEVRARLAERRASDVVSALSAASELVRQLRETVEGLDELPALLAELRARAPAEVAKPDPAEPPAPDSSGRKTVEEVRPPMSGMLPPPPDGEEEEQDAEEEMTKVVDRPVVEPRRAAVQP